MCRIATIPLCQNLRGKQLVLFDAPSWKYTGTQQSVTSWGSQRAQPSLKTRPFHLIYPKQFGAFPRSIVLPYPYREILSGYEEDVSSMRDDFTAWVKSDHETILKRHVVDSKGIYPAYREAPARRHSPSSSGYHFDNNVQTVQLSRRDSVSMVGILDLDVEQQEPLKATLRVNGTSLLYKNPSSTSSTTFLRTASM